MERTQTDQPNPVTPLFIISSIIASISIFPPSDFLLINYLPFHARQTKIFLFAQAVGSQRSPPKLHETNPVQLGQKCVCFVLPPGLLSPILYISQSPWYLGFCMKLLHCDTVYFFKESSRK